MNFIVAQKKLDHCLKNVVPFLDKGANKDILLTVKNNFLEVAATNSIDTAIVEKVAGNYKKDGSVVVPAQIFRNMVQTLPENEKINLEIIDYKLTITCKTVDKITINGKSPSSYTVFPTVKKDQPILTIKSDALKETLTQVVFVANKDTAGRRVLAGCLLHSFNNKKFLVATDSYRLAEKQLPGSINKKTNPKDDEQILLPATTLLNLERILTSSGSKEGKDVVLYKEPKAEHVLFVVGDGEIEIISALIAGTYPEYRKLLPEAFRTQITANRKELINATNRASIISQSSTNPVVLSWTPKGKELKIQASGSQHGEFNDTLPVKITTNTKVALSNQPDKDDNSGDDGTTITFNAKYLQEALKVSDSENVQLNMIERLKPCLIVNQLTDKKIDDTYRHAIMPLKS